MNELELRNKGVAYIVKHKDEIPENIKIFVQDLYGYEAAGKNLESARQEALKSIDKIEEQINQLYGSIDAIVRIIAREVGPEKLKEYAEKFNPNQDAEEKKS